MSAMSFSRLLRAVSGARWGALSPAASKRFCLECRAARRLFERSLAAPPRTGGGRPFSLQASEGSKKQPAEPPQAPKKEGGGPDEPPNGFQKVLMFLLTGYLAISLVSIVAPSSQHDRQTFVSWNEFYHNMLAKGEVEEIIVRPDMDLVVIHLVSGAIVKGRPAEKRVYFMKTAGLEHLETRLREAEKQLGVPPGSVPLVYSRETFGLSSYSVILFLGLLALLAVMSRRAAKGGGLDAFSQMGRARFTVVDHSVASSKPKVRFADVAGCHGAKLEIGEFIDYLQDSEKYKKLGAKYPKGVLLQGPPGCGKTMLAKAVAAEAQVPFLAMAGSEFIEMIGGLGAKRVRNLFQEARKRAPCMIYIDEIDAIGRKRSSTSANSGEEEQTLNQLLVEMDGISSKEGVIMLASTNRAEVLDQALLRPGRLDRHILIDLPNLAERAEIFDKHLGAIVLDRPPASYSARLAQLTPGFSGADIASVCNEAALHAARTRKRCVDADDVDYAVERVVGGTEKRTHAMSPEERRRVAVHQSGHALVAYLMKDSDELLKISIVPRTKGALGVARYIPSERRLHSTEQLFQRICTALGGRAAEVVVYGRPSTGAEADLRKVTEVAKAIVEQHGMDPVVGALSYADGRRPYSKKLANVMDLRAAQLVQKAYDETVALVGANRAKLKRLVDELVKNEVLDRKEVEAILGPRPPADGEAPPA